MDTHAQKWSVLTIAAIAAFLTPYMGSTINIALPTIGNEFAMDAVLLGWVATSYLLAAAMFIVPFGRLADIYGRKKIFTFGIVTFTLASFFSALAQSPLFLITCRVIHGIGSAMIFGTAVAILTSVFPPHERGKALGISVAATYLGLSLGPYVGGVLTQHLGWRSVFFSNVPLGLIVIVLIFWKLTGEWADAKGERFDAIGSLIYALMLAAIMYGFSQLPSLLGVWLILLGIMGVVAFVRWELRIAQPVFNVQIFQRNRVFTFSNVAALINYSGTFAISFLLSLYLQYVRGFPPQTAGLILIAQPIIMTIFSPIAGLLSDRVEPRILASTGMAVMAVGLALLIGLTEQTALLFIIADMIFLGFGYALFSSPNTNAVMSSVEKRLYGVASGILGTMRLIGMMFSMGIAMLILALYMGSVQITPAYHEPFLKGMRMAFVIFALLSFGGVWASLVRGTVHTNKGLSSSRSKGA
jgi:EmrB/QacA subfamily drug resistance transporter